MPFAFLCFFSSIVVACCRLIECRCLESRCWIAKCPVWQWLFWFSVLHKFTLSVVNVGLQRDAVALQNIGGVYDRWLTGILCTKNTDLCVQQYWWYAAYRRFGVLWDRRYCVVCFLCWMCRFVTKCCTFLCRITPALIRLTSAGIPRPAPKIWTKNAVGFVPGAERWQWYQIFPWRFTKGSIFPKIWFFSVYRHGSVILLVGKWRINDASSGYVNHNANCRMRLWLICHHRKFALENGEFAANAVFGWEEL